MDFSYDDITIRSLCEQDEQCVAKLGTTIATLFQNRLADLQAIENVGEIFVGNPGPYGNDGILYKVDIDENNIIIFSSGHATTPINDMGNTDWFNVSKIKIIKLETRNDE